MKLRVLKSGVRRLNDGLRLAPTPSDQRIAGRRGQQRRLKLWTTDPCCAKCGRLTDYPRGFELDHKVRLADGGPDTEANLQVLCVWFDDAGLKRGCHAEKTATEAGAR